jgi:hypothetical protein
MSNIRYTENRKNQRERYVSGVLQMEGRKQQFRTVGEGEGARRKAKSAHNISAKGRNHTKGMVG